MYRFISSHWYGICLLDKSYKNTAVKVPHRVKKPASISLIICLIVLGLLMPLFGLSLILVFIIELILYIKDRRAKQ